MSSVAEKADYISTLPRIGVDCTNLDLKRISVRLNISRYLLIFLFFFFSDILDSSERVVPSKVFDINTVGLLINFQVKNVTILKSLGFLDLFHQFPKDIILV